MGPEQPPADIAERLSQPPTERVLVRRRRYLADGAASVLDKSLDFERLAQAVEAAPAAHRIH